MSRFRDFQATIHRGLRVGFLKGKVFVPEPTKTGFRREKGYGGEQLSKANQC